MPVLILAGRYDALCPRYQLDFVRCAPQAEFRWVEPDFSHIEEPDSVMALLGAFFAKVRQGAGAHLAR
jgi:pimeloyl-ACP methyl ester carboxylesterase